MYYCHVYSSVDPYLDYGTENIQQTKQTHVIVLLRKRCLNNLALRRHKAFHSVWKFNDANLNGSSLYITMIRYLRPSPSLPWAFNTAPAFLRFTSPRITELGRSYATHSDLGRGPSTSSRRKNISVLSDDGRLQWDDLSGREKVSRATQQSFNFVVVLAGAVLTVSSFLVLFKSME